MNIFVISSPENYNIAKLLFADIIGVKLIQGKTSVDNKGKMEYTAKREINCSNFILPVIDSFFTKDDALMLELKTVLEYSRKLKKPIIPVLIESAKIPKELGGVQYIRIEEEDDLGIAKKELEEICARYLDNNTVTKKIRSLPDKYLITSFSFFISAIVLYYMGRLFRAASFLYIIPALCALFGAFFLVLYFARLNDERRERIYLDESQYYKQLEKKIVSENPRSPFDKAPKKDEINALGLMQVNLNNIEKYYKWSQQQAKSAFILAVWMCILGLLIFAVAVLLPTVFRASIEVAVITAIAGAIVELFAGTALVVYKNSVEQLNYYHKALHEDERFLSSVNLLREFSTAEKKDEVLHEIIKCEISMNTMGYDTEFE